MIDGLFLNSKPAQRVWVFSDLQQALPEMAEECLDIALTDTRGIADTFTHLWCLGDAMEGNNLERIHRMVEMQVQRLGALDLPLRFVMGNHDLDCTTKLEAGSAPVLPAWEAFRKVPGWKTTETFEDFYFTETLGEFLVVFLSDHVAPDNRWHATQQEVRGTDPAAYPVPLSAYQSLRDQMAAWPGPVVVAGHYAFPGGARGAPPHGLLNRLLPLPDNVRLALHGHAHTGDWPYGKEKTYQRIGWIDWHNVPQINVSSLDRTRGSQTRSVVLDLYTDGSLGVFFRDHEDKMWSDAFFVDGQAPRNRSAASLRHHGRRTRLEDTALHAWKSQHPSQ